MSTPSVQAYITDTVYNGKVDKTVKHIAIIGYGVVGGGITAFLEQNGTEVEKTVGEPVSVKYIVDLRTFPESPYRDRVVHTLDPVLADPDVTLVCETMGGAHPAYEYTMAAFAAGKSVVTSNKEVVATFGDALLAAAKKYGVHYAFEASVGGGIPEIRSMLTSLAAERITAISGIVNGTTNYVLTRMKNEGKSYDEIIEDAKKLGYAEANPAADVDGLDGMRKILILTALATGTLYRTADVQTETMRTVSARDIADAQAVGAAVKYIAQMTVTPDGMALSVCPRFVPETDILAHIHDVFNGIRVTTTALGDILYYGRGAGRLPTAAAVMADVCGILSGAMAGETIPVFTRAETAALAVDALPGRRYVRFAGDKFDALTHFVAAERVPGTTDAYITEPVTGSVWQKITETLGEPTAAYRFL